MVFNKIDRVFEPEIIKRLKRAYNKSVFVSALTGDGIEQLKSAILKSLKSQIATKTFTIPVMRGELINKIYENADIIKRTEKDNKVKLLVKGYRSAILKLAQEIKDQK
jgi:50S ribosomal subunit-associated GTPase HflX